MREVIRLVDLADNPGTEFFLREATFTLVDHPSPDPRIVDVPDGAERLAGRAALSGLRRQCRISAAAQCD